MFRFSQNVTNAGSRTTYSEIQSKCDWRGILNSLFRNSVKTWPTRGPQQPIQKFRNSVKNVTNTGPERPFRCLDCVDLWCCAELERLLCLYEFSFGLLRSLSKCLGGNLYIRTNGSTYYTSQPNLTHSITGTYMRKTSAEKEVSDISGRKIITLKGPQCIVDKYPKKSWQGNIWSPNPSLTQGSMVLFFWVSLVSDLITNRAPSKN